MQDENNLEMNIMDTKEILRKLKKGLLIARPELLESDFGPKNKQLINYKEFYFLKENENKNFFDVPGKLKLGTGTGAIKSSAAFIYNIFGKDSIIIENKKYKKIEFEKGLQTLLNRPNAELDGYLVSEDETKEIFFETKLLEWSGSPKNLAIAYLSEENYPKENKYAKEFISFFKTLVDENKKSESKGVIRVAHKTKVYDAIQMTIHILGIYNSICNHKLKSKNIELINLVWDYDHPRYKKEALEASAFVIKVNKTFIPLFSKMDVTFNVRYIPFSDFMKIVKFENQERLQYLNTRYLIK